MANTGMQIANLMMSNGKSAADMTHAVKVLGGGSMQRGFARIGEFFSAEVAGATAKGLLRGRIQGGIVGVLGTAAVGGLIWWFTRAKEAEIAHEAEGQVILHTMETAKAPATAAEEQADPDDAVTADSSDEDESFTDNTDE